MVNYKKKYYKYKNKYLQYKQKLYGGSSSIEMTKFPSSTVDLAMLGTETSKKKLMNEVIEINIDQGSPTREIVKTHVINGNKHAKDVMIGLAIKGDVYAKNTIIDLILEGHTDIYEILSNHVKNITKFYEIEETEHAKNIIIELATRGEGYENAKEDVRYLANNGDADAITAKKDMK